MYLRTLKKVEAQEENAGVVFTDPRRRKWPCFTE